MYEYVAVGVATVVAGGGAEEGTPVGAVDGTAEGAGDAGDAGDGSPAPGAGAVAVTAGCATGDGSALPGAGVPVRELPQYRQRMASSWISSAQYGHFFTWGLQRSWCTEG